VENGASLLTKNPKIRYTETVANAVTNESNVRMLHLLRYGEFTILSDMLL
jgi:hypothetical protein